jgi:hypothetical protein
MKASITKLREKIISEYDTLHRTVDFSIRENKISTGVFIEYSEYFFIKTRIYICFCDFEKYITINKAVCDFFLNKENASDYMAYIFMNGLVGDCDLKSVEGIIKLMIFSFNHAMYKEGKNDSIIPVEVTFP